MLRHPFISLSLLISLCVLTGCPQTNRPFYCAVYNNQCAKAALADFQTYISEHEAGVPLQQRSFLLLQTAENPDRQTGTVVLVHGFTGSPLHLIDTARIFYEHGYNVLSILLRGHGTSIEDMHANGTLSHWRGDLSYAVSIARSLSQQVILGGHSLGGALTIEYALDHPLQITTLALFDPMIALSEPFQIESKGSCAAPLLEVITDLQVDTLNEYKDLKQAYGIEAGITHDSFEIFPDQYPGAYADASMKSVCSMLDILKRFNLARTDLATTDSRWYTHLEQVPNILMIYSEDPHNIVSATVNQSVMEYIADRHPNGNQHVLPLPASAEIAHGVILDPQYNPLYYEVKRAIVQFLDSLPGEVDTDF